MNALRSSFFATGRLAAALALVLLVCALWTGTMSAQALVVVLVAVGTVLAARHASFELARRALDSATPRNTALAWVAKGVLAWIVGPAALAVLAASLGGTVHAPNVDFLPAWMFFGSLGTAPFLWTLRSALRGA